MTQEAKAIKYIQEWIDGSTAHLNVNKPYMQGYHAGILQAKEIVKAIINANIKPKKK